MILPARADRGAPVTVQLRMADGGAGGALGYQLDFGDGSASANAVPQFCQASPRTQERESWHFVHRYSRSGLYRISVVGRVNCTDVRASTAVSVSIG